MSRSLVSTRTHVVSLVAVFLALAIGIALGGGPLGGAASSDTSQLADQATDEPSAAAASAASAVDPAYADEFAANGAARLYADGLSGHAAAILALPGADAAQVKSLTAQVLAAGGALTGTYTLDAEALDPDAEGDLDSRTAELATSLGDPRVDPAADVHERTGRLLALAMATDQQSSTRADASAVTIRSAFADSGLLASPVDVRLAPLVLVVLPPGAESAGEDAALTGLVNGLGGYASGVVVTGDEDSAADGGLAALRAEPLEGAVATVDGLETSIGQVSTVLAMISVAGGVGGAFGESGADGAVPVT